MLAAQSQKGCISWEVVLCKGSRSRIEEDELASRLLVALLAEAAHVPVPKSFNYGLAAEKEPLKVVPDVQLHEIMCIGLVSCRVRMM
jgi:hypothetical protein